MIRLEVLLGCLIIMASCAKSENRAVTATPLTDFSAPFYFGLFELPQKDQLTVERVELGRMLFYEKMLSADSSVSCSTCHQQSKAFSDGKKLGEGFGNRLSDRNTMSIVNVLWSSPRMFWDGRAESLEDQALQPIEDTREMNLPLEEAVKRLMNSPEYQKKFETAFGIRKIRGEHIAKALAQFQRTLISQDSKYDKFLKGELQLSDQEQRGLQSFFTHPDASIGLRGSNCGDCHRNFLTDGFSDALDGFANNGLNPDVYLEDGLYAVTGNLLDKGKFTIPSLRNIALTAPYMHDGRFNTLDEVLDHYNEHIQESETLDLLIREASNEVMVPGDPIALKLTDTDKEDIIAFMLTLTDSSFINNEKFSDPFK